MKKRKLFVGLLVASAALGLASCGSKKPVDEPNDDPGTVTPDTPGTVTPQKTLSEITISGQKTTFTEGDAFDKSGLVVTAKYSDNTTENVTSKATVSTPDMSKAGTQKVTVTYEGKTAEYTITITAKKVEDVKTLKAITPDDLNATTTYEIGDTITYTGLALELTWAHTTGADTTETVTDLEGYTIEVTDASGTKVEGAFATAGTYTVTISKDSIKGEYTVTVTKKQIQVALEWNLNHVVPAETKADGETLLATGTVLYDSYGTKIVVGPDDAGKVKQQVYNASGDTTIKEINGVSYNGRLQLGGTGSASKTCLKITVTSACKIEVLAAAGGTVDPEKPRNLSLSNGQAFPTEQANVLTLTFDVTDAGDYYLFSSNSGINVYDIKFIYNYDEDQVQAHDKMEISGYETEFTTTGDTQFNLTAPQGLVVTSYNNKGGASVVSDYTVVVKDSTDAEIEAITLSGTYTVVIAIPNTELTKEYTITVTNPNATIEQVEVTTSNTTTLNFYGTDEFTHEDLTVVATDNEGLPKTLTAEEYTVELLNGEDVVEAFTTTGEYTVKVTYSGVSDTYVVNYYALGEKTIDTTNVKTIVALGTTEFTANGAVVKQGYEDEGNATDFEVDGANISVALYSDAECENAIADAETAFATAGTVYAKFSADGCADVVVTLTVQTISSMSYNATEASNEGWTIYDQDSTCKIGITDGSFASQSTTSVPKLKPTTSYVESAVIGNGTNTSVTVNILMGSTKTSNNITMTIEALDDEGNVIGTATCYSVKGYKPEGSSTMEKVTAYCTTTQQTASAEGYGGDKDIVVSVSPENAGKTISKIRISGDTQWAIVSVTINY